MREIVRLEEPFGKVAEVLSKVAEAFGKASPELGNLAPGAGNLAETFRKVDLSGQDTADSFRLFDLHRLALDHARHRIAQVPRGHSWAHFAQSVELVIDAALVLDSMLGIVNHSFRADLCARHLHLGLPLVDENGREKAVVFGFLCNLRIAQRQVLMDHENLDPLAGKLFVNPVDLGGHLLGDGAVGKIEDENGCFGGGFAERADLRAFEIDAGRDGFWPLTEHCDSQEAGEHMSILTFRASGRLQRDDRKVQLSYSL